ncbi:hypothetical protein K466DRAFT_598906 [Polyporus arcularius HHB13444]|uniref:BTB domain-containing protein n=1 Tax=Polyporus arcularius HHB13444 TaxID=1314778 RepID=A0A5C3PIT6_9APHY|nr:hypothetical protein K466DRAFT_598906 [Polyporus arcularius HHB13444]
MSKSSAPSQATLADPEVLQAKSSPTRDDDLWFDDGTLIVVAQNVEFRVYRNHLAERFEVFRDMLSFPQPTPSDSTDDLPCPAIHVTDSARDWRNVLRLLFHPEEQGLFVKRSDPSFDVVSACVRLGHKYQMTAVYQQAMAYLKYHFTADLLICKSRRNWVPPGFTLAHAIGVVNLARLTGEHTLLPIALMVCCWKEADIVEGFTYDDGEQEKLAHDDLGLCFAAKARLLKVTILAYFTTYTPPPPGSCELKDGDACRRALQGLADIAAREVQRATLPNPIVVLNYALTGSGPRLCNGCSTAVKSRQLERQRQNWKQLPSVLGIDVPGW